MIFEQLIAVLLGFAIFGGVTAAFLRLGSKRNSARSKSSHPPA